MPSQGEAFAEWGGRICFSKCSSSKPSCRWKHHVIIPGVPRVWIEPCYIKSEWCHPCVFWSWVHQRGIQDQQGNVGNAAPHQELVGCGTKFLPQYPASFQHLKVSPHVCLSLCAVCLSLPPLMQMFSLTSISYFFPWIFHLLSPAFSVNVRFKRLWTNM